MARKTKRKGPTPVEATAPPASGKIAVKVINHYGDEVLHVYRVAEQAESRTLEIASH